MIRSTSIEPLPIDSIKNIEYDAIIATVGYERRARYIADSLSPQGKQKIATAFTENCLLDFDRNLAFYKKAKYKIEHLSDEGYYEWAQQFSGNSASGNGESRFLIDISSMSRYRIAALVWALASCAGQSGCRVDFLYSFAKYNPPPRNTGPITNIGPVSSDFAGWFEEPSSTCSAIIGLGYDLGKSVGTIEYIGPGEIWAMNPIGKDKRYEKAVLKANKLFLDVLDEYRIIDYEVFRPFETYYRLESLVLGAMRSSRPVIIPFGPKIFTLCSLMVAVNQYPNVSVWRVSSGKYEPVANRVSSGTVIGLRVVFH